LATIIPIPFKIDEEYSKLVRPLNSKEDQDLENSLKENEQKEEIVVDQHGTIIEGHNRYHKLRKLGVPPEKIKYRVKYFEDRLAAKEYIIIVNKDRRQSYPFDKIEDAYKLQQIYQEKARQRQLANLKNVKDHVSSGPKEPNDKDNVNEEKGRVNDIVAKKFGLTPTQYKRGKKIIEEGNEEQKEKLRKGQSTITKESNVIDTKKKIEKLLNDAQNYKLSEKSKIFNNDFREALKHIPDNSIGLVITDPPYENTPENIQLYEDFGRLIIPKLKPGYTLLFLVGGVIVNKVIVRYDKLEDEGLKFWWEHAMEHTGSSTAVYEYGIEANTKNS
jgi:ParB-like chromosome segregation protein Spo0J